MPRIAALLALLVTVACDEELDLTDLYVCNDNLRGVVVFVVDVDRLLLPDLNHRTVIDRGLRPIVDAKLGPLPRGWYPVVSDWNMDKIKPEGDTLLFRAWDDEHMATATFVVGRNDCHIEFHSGPDTVIAEARP